MNCEACSCGIGPNHIHKTPQEYREKFLCAACVQNWQTRERAEGREVNFEDFLGEKIGSDGRHISSYSAAMAWQERLGNCLATRR